MHRNTYAQAVLKPHSKTHLQTLTESFRSNLSCPQKVEGGTNFLVHL